MLVPLETRRNAPLLVFDLVDQFAASQRLFGPRPRPLGWVRMRVTARVEAGGRIDLPAPLEMVLGRNSGGFDLFFGEVKLPDGQRRTRAVSPGAYDVRIDSQFYLSQTLQAVALPMTAAPPPALMTPIDVGLAPSYLYPFPESEIPSSGGATLLRGRLQETDGTGVENAVISLVGIANPGPYRTDRTGEWVFAFSSAPRPTRVTVHVEVAGRPPQDVVDIPIASGRTNNLRQTGLRGQVLRADGRPIEGAAIRVSGVVEESLTRQDGSWSFYFRDLNQPDARERVTAVLPDGHNQHQDVDIKAKATIVVPAFRFP